MDMRRGRRIRVAVGMVMMLCLGTLYAWSIFRTPFGERYPGWSSSDLALNFTVSMICYAIGGFAGGKLSARTSNTVTARLAAVLLLVGFVGVSFLPEEEERARLLLYLFYGVCSGLGTGLGYNSIVTGVSGWFPECSGRITGILLTGFGIGSLLIGQLAVRLIPALGLPAVFRGLAAVIFLVVFAGAGAARLPGKENELPPAPPLEASEDRRDYTTGEMVRRPTFWLFFLWNLLICSCGLMVINSAANIAVYYGMAAVLGLLISVCNGLSRIPFGILIDRVGRVRAMRICNGMLVASGLLLTVGGWLNSGLPVLLGMLLMGVCYGNSVTIGLQVVRQFYGTKHYATNMAVINSCAIPGSFLGPMVASALQTAAGGDYQTTFLVVLALAVVDLIVGLGVKKP